MQYKLGKTPARPGAMKLKFGTFFNAEALPVPPAKFGHYGLGLGLNWNMFANDIHSDCVFAGAAHETMVWTHRAGTGVPVDFTDKDVLADYAAVTGFNPSDPSTDQGTDMVEAAIYRQKTGILDANGVRRKIDSYVALGTGNVDQLVLATYLFGAVGIGIRFPASAMQRFNNGVPWDVLTLSEQRNDRIDGGHYIPCIGRNSDGNLLIVTWGRLHAMTPDFYRAFNDESVAYISLDPIKNNLSPEGFNLDQLRRDFASLQQMDGDIL
jgi:hypothetical protein